MARQNNVEACSARMASRFEPSQICGQPMHFLIFLQFNLLDLKKCNIADEEQTQGQATVQQTL